MDRTGGTRQRVAGCWQNAAIRTSLRSGLPRLPVGSKVDFPNLDPIFHNIFSLSRSETFDLGYYSEGKSRSVTFSRPGVVQVYCHIHPGMYGVIVVTPTIWSAIPADDGSFGWTGIPPGQYHLGVWQKIPDW